MKTLCYTLIAVLFSYSTLLAQWTDNGTNLTTPDNVGIGTETPDSKLVIQGGDLVLGNETEGNNRKLFLTNSRAAHYITANNWWTEFVSHNNEGWIFKDGDSESITFNTDGPYIFHSGNVGIGNANPQAKLDIAGATKYSGPFTGTILYGLTSESGSPNGGPDGFRIRYDGNFFANTQEALIFEKTDGNQSNPDGGIVFVNTGSDGIQEASLVIKGNGNIGIGTTTPDATLAVNGDIHTQEVRVDMTGWPDFVFNKDYTLPTLEEVETHIKANGHLKDIPSEAEVKANGINLGEMDAKLLQKIEELTLYIIDLQKQMNELRQQTKNR